MPAPRQVVVFRHQIKALPDAGPDDQAVIAPDNPLIFLDHQCRVGAPQTADLPKPSGAGWLVFERPKIAVA